MVVSVFLFSFLKTRMSVDLPSIFFFCQIFSGYLFSPSGSVSDPDPDWNRILEGKYDPQKKKFHVVNCWISFLSGGRLFLLRGSPSWRLKYKNIVFFFFRKFDFFSCNFCEFLVIKTWVWIRIYQNTWSRFFSESGSETLPSRYQDSSPSIHILALLKSVIAT
jgi:hypothetical protein